MDLNPKAKVRSIIGSSAGGIIALAISTGATTERLIEICNDMNKISRDRTIKTVANLTPEKINHYNRIKNNLRQLLHDHGIMHYKMYDMLAGQVIDDEVIDKVFDTIIEVLADGNESLKVMLSL
jgi:esterase/lipase